MFCVKSLNAQATRLPCTLHVMNVIKGCYCTDTRKDILVSTNTLTTRSDARLHQVGFKLDNMGRKITPSGLLSKTRRSLRERGLRYASVLGSHNLLVLKASGEYHYLLIQFEALPEYWIRERKYFNIKIAYAIDHEQINNAIDRYIQ